MSKPKVFKNTDRLKLKKLLNELEEYSDIYLPDHESRLLMKVFIGEKRGELKV